jgi:hypothetical protein
MRTKTVKYRVSQSLKGFKTHFTTLVASALCHRFMGGLHAMINHV